MFLSRDDLLNLRDMSQFHAACEWFGPGWTDFVATCPHSAPTSLGPILMSAHAGAKKNQLPTLGHARRQEWMHQQLRRKDDLPDAPTAACRAERAGAAELGVGWTGEKLTAHQEWPSKHFPSLLHRQERVETVSVNKGPCPDASQRSASDKAPRDGDSHGGRGRLVAHESRCSPRGRGASLQDSEVAMSSGHGEVPRLLGRFAGGSGDATTPPASASLRSPPRRGFCERERGLGLPSQNREDGLQWWRDQAA